MSAPRLTLAEQQPDVSSTDTPPTSAIDVSAALVEVACRPDKLDLLDVNSGRPSESTETAQQDLIEQAQLKSSPTASSATGDVAMEVSADSEARVVAADRCAGTDVTNTPSIQDDAATQKSGGFTASLDVCESNLEDPVGAVSPPT